jgi:hypothetical protein
VSKSDIRNVEKHSIRLIRGAQAVRELGAPSIYDLSTNGENDRNAKSKRMHVSVGRTDCVIPDFRL